MELTFRFMEWTMDRLESMSVLVTAVEAGSLSAAGRRLGMPLATVSRKVSELESHLRTRLLIRTRRGLTLTDAGRSYVAACKRILEDVGEAERAASGEYSAPKGDLIITAPIVFGRLHVLPIVIEFLKTYPDIDVRMVLADRITNLLEEQVDLAIRIGELPDSSLIATRVGSIRRVVCASPAYFAARGTPKRPDGARRTRLHHLRWPDVARCLDVQDAQEQMRRSRSIRDSSSTPPKPRSTQRSRASGSPACSRIKSQPPIRAGALAIALPEFEPSPWPVSLVFAGQGLLPLKLRAFLDFAAPRLRERLAERATRKPAGRRGVRPA